MRELFHLIESYLKGILHSLYYSLNSFGRLSTIGLHMPLACEKLRRGEPLALGKEGTK